MNQLKKEFTILFQLSSVSRYSRDHLLKPESVLEHIGFCTVYGSLLAGRLKKAGIELDLGTLFTKIAMHDLDEAILGDIPRTTKYFSDDIRSAFKEVEYGTISRLEKWLDADFVESWVAAKLGNEGAVLRILDMASVVYKNWTEVVLLRNRSFLRVCVETQRYLQEISQSYFNLKYVDSPSLYEKLEKELHAELVTLKAMNQEILNTFLPTEEDMTFIRMQELTND
jgi:5'-deoxynucleotidase YfbR-like HD superfamily hydrolase